MQLSPDECKDIVFYEGKGCEMCRGTGYSGRIGIFEYLPVDDEIRDLIGKKSASERIRQAAKKKGLTTLRDNGWEKVKQGITTIPEVLRVTLEG